MRYQTQLLIKLRREAQYRFDKLIATLVVSTNLTMPENTNICGTDIRLAVDDFKSILTEIRKLK